MKSINLAILTMILLGLEAKAQSVDYRSAETFLRHHSIKFNESVTSEMCYNLDSLERALVKKKFSYSRGNFAFEGNVISDSTFFGGGVHTYINDHKKPFMYYRIVKGEFGAVIEFIDGSNAP